MQKTSWNSIASLALNNAIHFALLFQVCTAMDMEALVSIHDSFHPFICDVTCPHPVKSNFHVPVNGLKQIHFFRLKLLITFGTCWKAACSAQPTKVKSISRRTKECLSRSLFIVSLLVPRSKTCFLLSTPKPSNVIQVSFHSLTSISCWFWSFHQCEHHAQFKHSFKYVCEIWMRHYKVNLNSLLRSNELNGWINQQTHNQQNSSPWSSNLNTSWQQPLKGLMH